MTETCFFERDPNLALERRTAVEAAGTFLLMLAATGAGLTAKQVFGAAPLADLSAIAAAIALALTGLIVAFGAVSGGHFNPLITGLQWLNGERSLRCSLCYTLAQCIGAILGALLANQLFGAGAAPAAGPPPAWRTVLSEVVASFALMTVVFCCARAGKRDTGPFAVGAWLFAAIFATPSTSYANPAISIAAFFAAGPVALSGLQILAFVPAEIAGALLALTIVSAAYPRQRLLPERVV